MAALRSFRCRPISSSASSSPRKNKRGQSYGMAVSHYQKPEELWGYEYVTSTYKDPALSAERIFTKVRELFPEGSEVALRKVLK